MARPDPFPADTPDDPDSLSFIIDHDDGHEFDCNVDAGEWRDVLTPEFTTRMAAILGMALAQQKTGATEIALLFTSDDAVAALNQIHRDKSGPTDVLSFPSGEDEFLGDIALAYGVMARQAQDMNIPLADHTLHLVLHGTLHLCGHDHIEEAEAEVMEGLEIDILARHGLTNPYQLTDGGAS
ncbi:MAG: rRNA maturation RNase YbeY [Alphaproteobacteria bacterium]|nr:rRNA maturation RNase YbeY [Alphaproteobacteria bacterium]